MASPDRIFINADDRGWSLVADRQEQADLPEMPTATDLQARMHDLERQLLQAQKLGSVGELAASITHEFNNILTTIINYAKLGLRHKDAANRDKAFDKILSAGQRAAKITTGLLAYARSKHSRREPQRLAQVVQDVLVLVEKDLHIHRVRLELSIAADPYAELNSGEIQQVLLNLIVNARQAMPPGGTLSIAVSQNPDEPWGEIAVRDTGSGIPPEKLPHIFSRFFTTKTADQDGRGGTGLGLAMCKTIMDAHQGRIRVESAPGRGTKFTLKFPLATAPDLAAACQSAGDSQRLPRETPAAATPV